MEIPWHHGIDKDGVSIISPWKGSGPTEDYKGSAITESLITSYDRDVMKVMATWKLSAPLRPLLRPVPS